MKTKAIVLALCAFMVGGAVATLSSCGGGGDPSSSSSSEDKQLVLSASTTTLAVGGSTTITVKVGGKNISSTPTFTSSDETVASVSTAGKVSALAIGETTITAALEGYQSGELKITVEDNLVDVNFVVNIKFSEESSEQAIPDGYTPYIGGPTVGDGSADSWGIVALTKQEDGTYSYVFEDCEKEAVISYNVYLGTSSNWWEKINNESVANAARTFVADSETKTVDATFTFVSGSVEELVVTVTPTYPSSITDADNQYIWAWSKITSTNDCYAINASGNWVYTYTDVALGTTQLTFTIGTATAAGWSYEVKVYPEITADTTALNYAIDFSTLTATVL